jgi:hypothetical protein
MIELEIQGLSPGREGLLIEVGRFVMASGFTLQRQRLVHDPHGMLLTMVVRGPSRGRKSLQAALDGCERFISVQVFPFVEGEPRPHFAASLPRPAYTPPPAPSATASAARSPGATPPTKPSTGTTEAHAANASASRQAPSSEDAGFGFIEPTPQPSAPTPIAMVATPFVERVPLGPDEPAVETMLRALEGDYPRIVPQLLALQQSVTDAARESSLALAGRLTGNWVFRHEYLLDDGLELREAIERIGAPALRALVEVDQQGTQLHLHDSPLCTADGHSGCSFFGGFLEGLLGPAIAPGALSIFSVCCRSYGADECVLAISD